MARLMADVGKHQDAAAKNKYHLEIEMAMKQHRKSHFKDIKKRYYFFPNPYDDCAFTRCPKCNNKTKVRKFPLVVHIDPNQMLLLNKESKYCPSCDLIVVKKKQFEALLATNLDQINPDIIGNNYLVMGVVERKDWKESIKRQMEPTEIIERMYAFKDVWNFEVIPAGWYPDGH